MPTKEEIEPQVISVVSEKSSVSIKAIKVLMDNESDDLYQDLGMGGVLINSLAPPFNAIATSYAGGLKVTMLDVQKVDTVTDCVDLVTKRANGKKK
jgi:hypothetical protein